MYLLQQMEIKSKLSIEPSSCFLFMYFVVILVFCATTVFAQSTCDPSKGLLTFNPDCQDINNPYCRQTAVSPTTYTCVACVSQCDCSPGDYCSSDSTIGIGTCQSFTPDCNSDGCECRPLSPSQILDSTFPDSWKCAVTYTSIITNSLQIDVMGVCNGGSCQICNARANPDLQGRLGNCQADDGTFGAMTCTVGGSFVPSHYATWAPTAYYEDPVSMWLAIYFPFIVLLLVVQFLTCQRANL